MRLGDCDTCIWARSQTGTCGSRHPCITCSTFMCRETIRDQLIPNAVSWYTGEAEDNEEEDDDEEEEDDDEDGEDDDDEVSTGLAAYRCCYIAGDSTDCLIHI